MRTSSQSRHLSTKDGPSDGMRWLGRRNSKSCVENLAEEEEVPDQDGEDHKGCCAALVSVGDDRLCSYCFRVRMTVLSSLRSYIVIPSVGTENSD